MSKSLPTSAAYDTVSDASSLHGDVPSLASDATDSQHRDVYIILSQSGSIICKTIQWFTGAEYCHASISLDDRLATMYSFGRRHPRFPFYGGYVRESPNYGTFKRFPKTKIAVLRFTVDARTYQKIASRLDAMYCVRGLLGYNYRGVFGAMFKKKLTHSNHYYCSEFVDMICSDYNLYSKDVLPDIVHPIDFYRAFQGHIVYRGYLSAFCTT